MRSWETLQGLSIRIQRTASSVGRYKCTNCNAPVKLGQEKCENCSQEIKQCSICKLPIKKDQEVSTCEHCLYPPHKNQWDQWVTMKHPCPVCKQ